ncbi:MAG: bacillithiol biosynthesis deacetylase BshB1 [candidate division Zixibacteria bacterium]|nr:bacillithiol biosynthesis deacetylase BshB1 [candidate division Zixibacteria bacterium]
MSDTKLDVLAFAAHCDDIEITSGGLLIKLVDLGYKVGACDLTAGEMGTKGTKEDRLNESQCAARVMGLSARENLEFPDAQLEFKRDYYLKMAEVIRKYQPHLVILPHWEQRHPDHRICSYLGQDACYFSGLKKLDLPGEPHRPHKILFATYYRTTSTPTFYVDISKQFERKIEAVRCYKSQFDNTPESKQIFHPGTDVFDYIKTRDHNQGLTIRTEYAEAYIQKEPMQIDDPMNLKVRSV